MPGACMLLVPLGQYQCHKSTSLIRVNCELQQLELHGITCGL